MNDHDNDSFQRSSDKAMRHVAVLTSLLAISLLLSQGGQYTLIGILLAIGGVVYFAARLGTKHGRGD